MFGKIATICLISGILAEDRFLGSSLGQAGIRAAGYAAAGPYAESNYPAQPYSFGYDNVDEYGNTQFHKEEADANNARTGSYGYTDANGLYRRVNYVADANGFRATIETNEPGTQAGASADAVFNASPVAAPAYAAPAAPAYSNPAGAGQAGYAKVGYNQAGYDQTGYDQAGYSKPGFGQVGFGKPLTGVRTRGFRG